MNDAHAEIRKALAEWVDGPATIDTVIAFHAKASCANIRALLAERDALEAKMLAYRSGNTALLEALMDMVLQHCCGEPDDMIRHAYISSNEAAVDVLEEAGMIENDRLNWPALQRRKQEVASAIAASGAGKEA